MKVVENHLQNYNLEFQSPTEKSTNITEILKSAAKNPLPPLVKQWQQNMEK